MQWFANLENAKRLTLKDFFLALGAYHIAILVTYLVYGFDLNFYDINYFHSLIAIVYFNNLLFFIGYLAQKQVTPRFTRNMLNLQVLHGMFIYLLWSFILVEQRVIALIFAMVVLSFLYSNASLIQSFLATLTVSLIHLGTFYVGTSVYSHPGTFNEELLYTFTFFATASLISIVLHRLTSQLEKRASKDYLTGLINRRAMTKLIEEEYHRNQRYKGNSSLVMIDLDNFKLINDHHGHKIGDEALKYVSEKISIDLRKNDFLARWGGEEFLLLLVGVSPDNAEIVFERILNHLRQSTFDFDDCSVHISVSAGLVGLTEFESADRALLEADKLLYLAKKNGKNRIVTQKNLREGTL
jgi:diguanylate cyclase (GGDEF)-like protein